MQCINNMKWIVLFVVEMLFLGFFYSCKQNEKRAEAEKMVTEWIGKSEAATVSENIFEKKSFSCTHFSA